MPEDREFDRMLEEELTRMPLPDGAVAAVTPWQKAMRRIVLGLGLTTLTLNLWYLDHLLPAAGVLLLFLGFRTLRRENGWFFACWVLSMIRLAGFFAARVWDAAIWPDLPPAARTAAVVLDLLQTFCLWQGVKAVRRCAGQRDQAGAAAALLVFKAAIAGLGFLAGGELQLQGIFWVVVLLGIYLCVLRSLAGLPALLDKAGYVVQAAPIRVADWGIGVAWAALLAAGVLTAGALFCRYPMEWAPVKEAERQDLETLRADLLALGMPEQVLDDLAAEDLTLLEDAVRVTVQVSEEPFNRGREVRSVSGSVTHTRTVYDVKELYLSHVAVELPGGRWRIIHHFFWQEDPGLRTTECIKLWPAANEGNRQAWRLDGAVTGRLLFDRQGATYAGDYYQIGEERYTTTSRFRGESDEAGLFALFSLPRRGEDCRGYLTYGMQSLEDGHLLDSWVNYTHQVRWLNYPAITAHAHDMSGAWNGSDAFQTVRAALQFYPKEGVGGVYVTQ